MTNLMPHVLYVKFSNETNVKCFGLQGLGKFTLYVVLNCFNVLAIENPPLPINRDNIGILVHCKKNNEMDYL